MCATKRASFSSASSAHPRQRTSPRSRLGLTRVFSECVCGRHGRSLDGISDAADSFASDQPVLASCYGASAADVQRLGPAAGRLAAKLVRPLRLVRGTGPGALAEVGGVNIHAAVAVDGRDRPRLERLCRYIARPPLSLERLETHPDGRVRIRFKSAWKDGTHSVLLDPLDFISRLRFLGTTCALVPPPRFHMLRYHGILAGHSRDRAEMVPQESAKDESSPTADAQQLLFEPVPPLSPPPPPSRHPWADLLRRVFAIDIMTCPHCQGAMRVKSITTKADDIRAILGTTQRARPPPSLRQLELDFAAP